MFRQHRCQFIFVTTAKVLSRALSIVSIEMVWVMKHNTEIAALCKSSTGHNSYRVFDLRNTMIVVDSE